MVRLRWKLALVVSTYRPFSSSLSEKAIEAFLVLDVGLLDDLAPDLLDHRQHALAEGCPLIGEGHLGARGMQGLGDAPGDRALIGHAHDQSALAGHHLGHFRQAHGPGRRVGGRCRRCRITAGCIGDGGEEAIVGHVPPQWL
jgi:hypothetical protein